MSRYSQPSNSQRSNSYSPAATYYLVCDPTRGEVVVRAHKYNYQLAHSQPRLVHLNVTRVVWNSHRAGSQLDVSRIHEPDLGRWVRACDLANRKSKLASEARRVLEELDRDNLGT